MARNGVEIILIKQLASCLRIPVALLNPDADLIFFNEPAEAIFGQRFEETGVIDADEWPRLLQPGHESGDPMKSEERPLMIALEQHVPAHRSVWMRAPEGGRQPIEATALPLLGIGDHFLGVLSLFWTPSVEQKHRGGDATTWQSAGPGPRQHEVETILTRRIAALLASPIFLVDRDGALLYFNPAAATILGRDFEEHRTGEGGLASRGELYRQFRPRDERGEPIPPEEDPLFIARARREPVHGTSRIHGLDGRDRLVAITAIPLVGQSDRLVGAFAAFWEVHPS